MKKLLLTLLVGIFLITLVRADTQTLQIRFIVPDQTAPVFDNLRNLSGYTNQAFTRYITATDDVGIYCYYLNDTSVFNVDCTGKITNSITLDNVTVYNLNLSVNDTLGNLNWGEFYINITNQATGGTALTCRYKKFGYFNDNLYYFKEANCI
jgi:hypothetical protein